MEEGTFLLYSWKVPFGTQGTSPRLSDVERSVILWSVFAIGSTLTYGFSGNVPLLHCSTASGKRWGEKAWVPVYWTGCFDVFTLEISVQATFSLQLLLPNCICLWPRTCSTKYSKYEVTFCSLVPPPSTTSIMHTHMHATKVLIAERISARLWIKDLFSQSEYVRTYVHAWLVMLRNVTPNFVT